MTEKQNYMLLLSGQQPEWIPYYDFFPDPKGKAPPTMAVGPSFLSSHVWAKGPAKDLWGVTWVPSVEAGGAKLPEPNNFILKDIRKWRDVIKAPDISGFDWEALAKKDMERYAFSREDTAYILSLSIGFFQYLMAFMGFNEGLCAMYEEPEEVKALMEYLCDFYTEVAEKSIDYFKPDIVNITDDTATWQNPFISLDMYRDMIKPSHARTAKLGTDRGLPVQMHCCGRCEEMIDDWREFGVVSWNPAQTSNDLSAIKRKYSNSLVINGGWEQSGELLSPDCSEEAIAESIRETFDKLAPGGGYAFCGGFLGPLDDEKVKRKNRLLRKAVETYGKTFYHT